MSLATDANISRLQQMFPSVEGDVIAIVLNDCGNNGRYRSHLSLKLVLLLVFNTYRVFRVSNCVCVIVTALSLSQLKSVSIIFLRLAEKTHHLAPPPNRGRHGNSGRVCRSHQR